MDEHGVSECERKWEESEFFNVTKGGGRGIVLSKLKECECKPKKEEEKIKRRKYWPEKLKEKQKEENIDIKN